MRVFLAAATLSDRAAVFVSDDADFLLILGAILIRMALRSVVVTLFVVPILATFLVNQLDAHARVFRLPLGLFSRNAVVPLLRVSLRLRVLHHFVFYTLQIHFVGHNARLVYGLGGGWHVL